MSKIDELLATSMNEALTKDERLAAWRDYEVERYYAMHHDDGLALGEIPIDYRDAVYQLISERSSLARKELFHG